MSVMAILAACGTSAPGATVTPEGTVVSVPAVRFVHPDGLFQLTHPENWAGRLLDEYSSPGFIETWAFASQAVLDGEAASVEPDEPFALVGTTVLWLASAKAGGAAEFSDRIVNRSRTNRENVSVFVTSSERTDAVAGYDGMEVTIERRTSRGISLVEICRHLVERDGPSGYEVCARVEQRFWPGLEPQVRSLVLSFEPLPSP